MRHRRTRPMASSDSGRFIEEARTHLADHYGLAADVEPVASELGGAFVARAGDSRFTLKYNRDPEAHDAVCAEIEALRALERAAPELPLPRVVPTRTGLALAQVGPAGPGTTARLLTYLEGDVLGRRETVEDATFHALGVTVARLDSSLASFSHPGISRDLLWDLRRIHAMVEYLRLLDPTERDALALTIGEYDRHLAARLPDLPHQAVHNDINLHNVLVDPRDATRIAGIIDFGDLLLAPRVFDPAIACAYVAGAASTDPLHSIRTFLAGYGSQLVLTQHELAVLPTLVRVRLAMILCLSRWRAAQRPENARYALRTTPQARSALLSLVGADDSDFLSRERMTP